MSEGNRYLIHVCVKKKARRLSQKLLKYETKDEQVNDCMIQWARNVYMPLLQDKFCIKKQWEYLSGILNDLAGKFLP